MTRARRRRVSTWCGPSSRPCGMRWRSWASPRPSGWRRPKRSPRWGRAPSFDIELLAPPFLARPPRQMVQTRGMRDGHRLREKIELTIDDRQVAALAVGALLLLAGMFALGLLVGMQIARRSPQPALAGDLVALDEQRAHAQRSAPPRAAAVPEPAAPKPAAESTVAAAPARPEAAKKELPPPPTTVSVAPARTVAVTPEGPPALPEPPADPGKFTVQLGALQDGADAAQLAARAAAVGLKAYVAEVRLPGKGVWYRVRVGAFADKESAERFRRDVERELRTSAVVMPAR